MKNMDPPETNPEAEQIASIVKEKKCFYTCGNFDKEVVHKIAQVLLLGLATACVDNTTGLFKGPGSVAVDIRKEMVDCLMHKSESYVAEIVADNEDSVIENCDQVFEVIADFIDDFASSKRNLLSHVSGWLLSENREDKIDDFVQEMESNGFWLLDRREALVQTLLKNIDVKSEFLCNAKFESNKELEEHKKQCKFQSVNCLNEGCDAIFCAIYEEQHDFLCPYKVLQCEQNCSEYIVRSEMDRHCITVCPMKLINCPFYPVGCSSTFAQCTLEQHCLEFLHSHLVHVLQTIHKGDPSFNLEEHALLLEKLAPDGKLSGALNVRSLTVALKDQEAKMEIVQEAREPT